MTTSSVKGRSSISLLAGAVLLTASLTVGHKAHADAATATVLGGAALYSSLMHAAEPRVPAPVFPQASVPPAPIIAQPVAMAMPALSPLHEPTVYTSVSPTAPEQPRIPMMQPISYQVSAPSLPPLNMPSYQSGPMMQQPLQLPPQSMQMQMPQQSLQLPPQSMPMQMPQQPMPMQMPQQSMQVPQLSAGSPSLAGFQGGSLPMMQQSAMLPQQGATMSIPPGMMAQQTAGLPPQTTIVGQQGTLAGQGGYTTSMPANTFAYAR
ncbi:MAG: hypothetical protein HQL76_05235 [Magnetococcales bacterium]|nr:hypothetical protein [Magnetococcales bacterium]